MWASTLERACVCVGVCKINRGRQKEKEKGKKVVWRIKLIFKCQIASACKTVSNIRKHCVTLSQTIFASNNYFGFKIAENKTCVKIWALKLTLRLKKCQSFSSRHFASVSSSDASLYLVTLVINSTDPNKKWLFFYLASSLSCFELQDARF